jgi:hypothetical protein
MMKMSNTSDIEKEIEEVILRACKAYHGAALDPYSDYIYTPIKAADDIMTIMMKWSSDE